MTGTPSTSSTPPDRSLQLQCACTLLVAVGAAYVSYRHGREFAHRFGADETTATLWPLIVDGLLTIATIELVHSSEPLIDGTLLTIADTPITFGSGLPLPSFRWVLRHG